MTYTDTRPPDAPVAPDALHIGAPATGRDERSIAELVKLATEQLSTLVRDELKLAQTELAEKARHVGRGIGMFGAAGLVALYGVAGVLTAAVLALALVLPAWLAALIVGVALLAVAGVLAIVGRTQVKRATPPVPTTAVKSVRADITTVTEAAKHGGHR